jgi:hypothetical protein
MTARCDFGYSKPSSPSYNRRRAHRAGVPHAPQKSAMSVLTLESGPRIECRWWSPLPKGFASELERPAGKRTSESLRELEGLLRVKAGSKLGRDAVWSKSISRKCRQTAKSSARKRNLHKSFAEAEPIRVLTHSRSKWEGQVSLMKICKSAVTCPSLYNWIHCLLSDRRFEQYSKVFGVSALSTRKRSGEEKFRVPWQS